MLNNPTALFDSLNQTKVHWTVLSHKIIHIMTKIKKILLKVNTNKKYDTQLFKDVFKLHTIFNKYVCIDKTIRLTKLDLSPSDRIRNRLQIVDKPLKKFQLYTF